MLNLKINNIYKFVATFFIVAIFFIPVVAFANDYGLRATADAAGLSGYSTDLPKLIGNVIGGVLSLIAVIFFILMVYGGLLWMTARGNTDQVKKAQDAIISAVIGIVVVLSAYAITTFVFTSISGSISGGGAGGGGAGGGGGAPPAGDPPSGDYCNGAINSDMCGRVPHSLRCEWDDGRSLCVALGTVQPQDCIDIDDDQDACENSSFNCTWELVGSFGRCVDTLPEEPPPSTVECKDLLDMRTCNSRNDCEIVSDFDPSVCYSKVIVDSCDQGNFRDYSIGYIALERQCSDAGFIRTEILAECEDSGDPSACFQEEKEERCNNDDACERRVQLGSELCIDNIKPGYRTCLDIH